MELNYNIYGYGNNNPNIFQSPQTNITSIEPDVKISLTLGNGKFHIIKDLTLEQLFTEVYRQGYSPMGNLPNLKDYMKSIDYQRHASTACIYHASTLSGPDALRIVFQREPTNIFNTPGKYYPGELMKFFGYEQGVFNDATAKKIDGTSFKDLPNTVCVYSETYLWSPNKRYEVAILSLPAPALNSINQPHFKYYITDDIGPVNKLKVKEYQKEIKFLFSVATQTIIDNYRIAFNREGFRRIVVTRFGQGSNLRLLSKCDQNEANNIYQEEMNVFLESIQHLKLEIVMSERKEDSKKSSLQNIGDIIENTRDYDFIICPSDLHSAPGNGNDLERMSINGNLGSLSGILPTQSSWFNPHLRTTDSLRCVQ